MGGIHELDEAGSVPLSAQGADGLAGRIERVEGAEHREGRVGSRQQPGGDLGDDAEVPSDPTNRPVRSSPATPLAVRRPVRMTSPPGSTTCSPRT